MVVTFWKSAEQPLLWSPRLLMSETDVGFTALGMSHRECQVWERSHLDTLTLAYVYIYICALWYIQALDGVRLRTIMQKALIEQLFSRQQWPFIFCCGQVQFFILEETSSLLGQCSGFSADNASKSSRASWVFYAKGHFQAKKRAQSVQTYKKKWRHHESFQTFSLKSQELRN